MRERQEDSERIDRLANHQNKRFKRVKRIKGKKTTIRERTSPHTLPSRTFSLLSVVPPTPLSCDQRKAKTRPWTLNMDTLIGNRVGPTQACAEGKTQRDQRRETSRHARSETRKEVSSGDGWDPLAHTTAVGGLDWDWGACVDSSQRAAPQVHQNPPSLTFSPPTKHPCLTREQRGKADMGLPP